MTMHYQHRIQYYETDKQGVTHHTNYIRIMEETRVNAMEQIGFGYERMEATGVFSPVMSVTCDYKRPTTFPDLIDVEFSVIEMGRLKIRFAYTMRVNDQIVCTATSLHCFLRAAGRPVAIEEQFPELYQALLTLKQE